jgi:hypothetical protein
MNTINHGGHKDRADHKYLCPLWSKTQEFKHIYSYEVLIP